jgi:hypothetical protein
MRSKVVTLLGTLAILAVSTLIKVDHAEAFYRGYKCLRHPSECRENQNEVKQPSPHKPAHKHSH